MSIFKKIAKLFDSNEWEVKKIKNKYLVKINALEQEMKKLKDEDFKRKTAEFKERIKKGESLDSILPEAFALVREAAVRTIGMRHFDVQMIGGVVLHQGRIAEMKTGEGKTLVATLPAYLNSLEGKGVHVVTVNEYLAKRDRDWMAPVYEFLGLTVGVSLNEMSPAEKRQEYAKDITYVTNNEVGFDYLRDNMAFSLEDLVLRDLHFAIIDEVDSILIDEARTPLIISGRGTKSTDLYYKMASIARQLKRGKAPKQDLNKLSALMLEEEEEIKEEGDYFVDKKAHAVPLTEQGVKKVEKLLGIKNLYAEENMEYANHISIALKAKELYRRDIDYVVKDGEVIIVDEFTGRLMYGRRYSDGIHQAIEAKEGLKVKEEDQTLASITFQNFFRLYKKISGMTGTAATEEREFREIYNLDVVVIPTNKPMIRKDYPDVIFRRQEAKIKAILEDIKKVHKTGRPILVGTRSIEMSEYLSKKLKKMGIKHNVLNAKYHEKEAEIIAQAGRIGTVTIATNMAGRGVDIVLGGNPPDLQQQKKVKELGGLYIIGTERHESRRIDNQLRGRAGRQGDPGASRFYVSFEDELLKIFGAERIEPLLDRLGFDDDTPIEHPIITKQLEMTQKKIESYHFDIRKNVLDYDEVLNQQRMIVYKDRRRALEGKNLKESIQEMIVDIITELIDLYVNPHLKVNQWDFERLWANLKQLYPLDYKGIEELKTALGDYKNKSSQEIKDFIVNWFIQLYEDKEKELGSEIMREIEKFVLLRSIDTHWMEHLQIMDSLKEGIGLRGYGQKDPKIEYQNEAFEIFSSMQKSIKEQVVKYIYRIKLAPVEYKPTYQITSTNRDESLKKKPKRVHKVGRNDPCPCGSGKKYKHCCGRFDKEPLSTPMKVN